MPSETATETPSETPSETPIETPSETPKASFGSVNVSLESLQGYTWLLTVQSEGSGELVVDTADSPPGYQAVSFDLTVNAMILNTTTGSRNNPEAAGFAYNAYVVFPAKSPICANRKFAEMMSAGPGKACSVFLGQLSGFENGSVPTLAANESRPLTTITTSDLGGLFKPTTVSDEALVALRESMSWKPSLAVALSGDGSKKLKVPCKVDSFSLKVPFLTNGSCSYPE